MSTVVQRSFAGGEISPSLYSRVDTVKYTTGLRTCRNFYVKRSGGVDSRPGTEFIAEVKDSTKRVRLLPFIFNADQTYVLEFGDGYMRVIRNAAQITVSGVSAWDIGTTYSQGDLAVDAGINYYSRVDSNTGNTPGSSPDEWYSLTGDIFEIPTPYAEADLQELNIVQSADIVTITHQSYPIYELARTGHTAWTLKIVDFKPSIDAPTNLSVSGSSGTTDEWVVTAIKDDTFEESLPSDTIGASSRATSGSPRTITWDPVDGAKEYNVYKKLNDVYGFVGVAGDTSFEDDGIPADTTDTAPDPRNPFAVNPIGDAEVNAGGSGYVVGDKLTVVQTGASDGEIQVDAVSGGAVTAFTIIDGGANYSTATGVATSGGTGTGCTIDITEITTGNFPATAGFYQQRLIFANTENKPETVYMSKTGFFKNFTTSSPLQDDDAVTFTLNGRRVNAIQQVLDLGSLITLSSDAEWLIQGDAAGIVRPGEINAKTQSYNGSSSLKPILINDNALFVQARGTKIRDLFATIEASGNIGYKGTDLTIFADHLFRLWTIQDWDYSQIPNSLVWAIRSDGTLLGFTYLREHQIWAWHRHDSTNGTFENVVTVPEGDEDYPYFVIKRTINGVEKRYIERMATRRIDDVRDYIGMDSTLSFDGRNTGSTSMTLSGGTDWDYTETLTLTASAAYFVPGYVGNQVQLNGSDGTQIRANITAYTSDTEVSVKPNKTVPVSMRNVAITDWALAVDELSGLDHLEGQTVSVMGDGFVVGSPNNASYNTYTVTSGTITLSQPYAVIHVGLPITCDVETLDIDSTQTEPMADKQKIVLEVTLFVEDTRGVWVGARPPSDDDTDPLEGLVEHKPRDEENYDDPVALLKDQIDIKNQPEWNNNGRVFIRQVDPLPLTLLAVLPAGMFPFTRGA